MPITFNGPKKVQIRETGNASYVIVGNTSSSNVARGTENVQSATISQIFWSTDALIKIQRGANTVLNLTGTGSLNLRGAGFTNGEFGNATLVVNTATANATIFIEIIKDAT